LKGRRKWLGTPEYPFDVLAPEEGKQPTLQERRKRLRDARQRQKID
jgi:hypothetical protein